MRKLLQVGKRTVAFALVIFVSMVGATRIAWAQEDGRRIPGTLLWEDQLDQARHFDFAVTTAAASGIVVTAGETTDASFNTDILVRAYAARTGVVLWQKQVDVAGDYDHPEAVAIDDGIAVVSGSGTTANGDTDWLVLAYDLKTGTPLWQDRHDYDGKSDVASALTIRDDRVFAAGAGACPIDTLAPCDWITRVYDLRSGALAWEDRFDGNGGDDYVTGVTTLGNRVFTVGAVGTSSSEAAFVVRAQNTRTGALLWQDEVQTPGFYNWAITVTARDGRVFAVGYGSDDWLVRSYDVRTGHVLWQATYSQLGISVPGVIDGPFKVAADGTHLLVSGFGAHGTSRNSRDWVVAAYDLKTGALLWRDQYDTGGFDEAVGGLATQHGQVFAYGIVGTRGFDMFIRAYDADSGHILWQDSIDKSGFTDSSWGVWTNNLAADHGLVTIVGGSEIVRSSGRRDFDWIVRTYDAGFHGQNEEDDGERNEK